MYITSAADISGRYRRASTKLGILLLVVTLLVTDV